MLLRLLYVAILHKDDRLLAINFIGAQRRLIVSEFRYGVCVFAAAAFNGPVAGTIIGGFVTQSHLGWRWTAWGTCNL